MFFWFSLCFFDFFGFEMQKQKSTWVFLIFLKVYGWRKSPKTKKHNVLFGVCISKPKTNKKTRKTQKKTSFEAKPSSLFKVFFLFWGLAVLVILYILQAFRYTKITNRVYICLYYLCVCVSYMYTYIYTSIYMYVCLEGHDTRGFEVDLRGGILYIH